MHKYMDSKGHDNLARGSKRTWGAPASHELLNHEVADKHQLFYMELDK
jgi:hypothetical protein